LSVWLAVPLARALAELHGGTLTLDSAPGRGTNVRVTLPAERLLELRQRRTG
jgi:signal transduction histidine kinase